MDVNYYHYHDLLLHFNEPKSSIFLGRLIIKIDLFDIKKKKKKETKTKSRKKTEKVNEENVLRRNVAMLTSNRLYDVCLIAFKSGLIYW